MAKADSKLADSNDIPQIVDAQDAIVDPTGGTTADAEARTALIAVLEALRAHGLIKE